MASNSSDTAIIVYSIFSLVVTFIIFIIAYNKRKLKNSFLGSLLGIVGGVGILFFGLAAAFSATLIVSYPLEIALTTMVSLAVFSLPIGAFIGLRFR